MSYDDDNRGNPNAGRDRGAYTPPTGDDDLPFNRSGYDPRRAPQQKSPPLTLIISAVILLLLVVAVVMFYRSGLRASNDAPPAVGTQVETMKVDAPLDAQPSNPDDGIRVYRDAAAETEGATPTFTPGPEEVLPRPAPSLEPQPAATTALAPAAPVAAPKPAAPAPVAPAPAPKAATPAPAPAPAPVAATGSSRVQIGAFSTTAIADREYAAVASRFGSFTSGAGKGVEEVTTASGSTVYRTTVTGMSRDRAVSFCNALKAAGRDCLVR